MRATDTLARRTKAAEDELEVLRSRFAGGVGASDHGALTGLADDDHSQYHNDARGDARYRADESGDTGSFPTQYAGLRFFKGGVQELCLVALADAPAGAQWRIDKGGTTYAVYLVDTTDPDASHVRIKTPAGVKAARLKT